MDKKEVPDVVGVTLTPLTSRNWTYTAWAEPDWKLVPTIKYYTYGKEICPETKKLHYQGYVEFNKKMSLRQVKILDEKAHWEPRRGTQQQAIEYCHKDKDIFEHGTKNAQGKRNDLVALKETLDQGGDHYEINFGCAIKYPRGIAEYKKHLMAKKFAKTQRNIGVCWIWGKSGTGKSKTARQWFPNMYTLPVIKKGNVWFDGYEGEPELLIEDLGFGDITREEMLRFLDRYPLQVPIKGGFVWAGWNIVIITSNYHWSHIYVDDPAIARRITHTIEL